MRSVATLSPTCHRPRRPIASRRRSLWSKSVVLLLTEYLPSVAFAPFPLFRRFGSLRAARFRPFLHLSQSAYISADPQTRQSPNRRIVESTRRLLGPNRTHAINYMRADATTSAAISDVAPNTDVISEPTSPARSRVAVCCAIVILFSIISQARILPLAGRSR